MSRKEWHESLTRGYSYDGYSGGDPILSALATISNKQEVLSKKTTDPQAHDYDEANVLFESGVKAARIGDFETAVAQISTAYLLDGRSITFMAKLRDNMPVIYGEEMKNYILDGELLGKLIHQDPNTFGADILHIILALHLGSVQGRGQELIAIALVRIDRLVAYLEEHPEIEDPNNIIMGGCLTRKALLYQKSSLHMGLGNYKKAMKDLTQALEIDEFYTQARESRACVWAGRNLKDDETIYAEFRRIVRENHVDNRGNEVAYAFLAMAVLGNSSLGTFKDAKAWYDKMLKASKRRDEIYGRRRQDELPPAVQSARRKFRECGDLDILDSVAGIERMTLRSSTTKRACLNCGATAAADGGGLSQCKRCKTAYYCSRECQVKDWKEHKKMCKMLEKESSNA